jgi:recombinational DNA repair ATPase RecF
MFLKHLHLKSFRNYGDQIIEFSAPKTILVGENAQGKSNLLEAVELLSTLRSHRATRDRELVQNGESLSQITATLQRSFSLQHLALILRNSGRRTASLNSETLRRQLDLLGTLNTVQFSSLDLDLVRGGPGQRRDWLDNLLIQLEPYAAHLLQQYSRVLRQRNALLREFGIRNSEFGSRKSEFGSQNSEMLREDLEFGVSPTETLRDRGSEMLGESSYSFGDATRSEFGEALPNLDPQPLNPEPQTPNAELQTNSEPQTPNAELQTNSEPRTPNSELQTNSVRVASPKEKPQTPNFRIPNSEFRIPNSTSPPSLPLWNVQLATIGTRVMRRRVRALNRLGPLAQHWHSLISGGQETLEIRYLPNVGKDQPEHWDNPAYLQAAFLEQVAQRSKAEQYQGVSLVGPHRDEVELLINGTPARQYGSQGQQRTIVLALKLAELQLLDEVIEDPPLLLLDDVLAELDLKRQNQLLEAIYDRFQTLITTTHLGAFDAQWLHSSQILSVQGGQIT